MSQKELTCAEGDFSPKAVNTQSLAPVSTTSNPAMPATTIKVHANFWILWKPKGGITIPPHNASEYYQGRSVA